MPIGLETSPYMSQATPAFEGVGDAFLRARGQSDQLALQKQEAQRLAEAQAFKQKMEAADEVRRQAAETRTADEYGLKKPGLQNELNTGITNNNESFMANEAYKNKQLLPEMQDQHWQAVRAHALKNGADPDILANFPTADAYLNGGLAPKERQTERMAVDKQQAMADAAQAAAQDKQAASAAAATAKNQFTQEQAARNAEYARNLALLKLKNSKATALKDVPMTVKGQLNDLAVNAQAVQGVQGRMLADSTYSPTNPVKGTLSTLPLVGQLVGKPLVEMYDNWKYGKDKTNQMHMDSQTMAKAGAELTKEITGVSAGKQERAVLSQFLPTATDTQQDLMNKIKGYLEYNKNKQNNIRSLYKDGFKPLPDMGNSPVIPTRKSKAVELSKRPVTDSTAFDLPAAPADTTSMPDAAKEYTEEELSKMSTAQLRYLKKMKGAQ